MKQPTFVTLQDRGLIAIAGADRVSFLQGLISQDVEKVDSDTAAYGALLTPQGKFLYDFCIATHGDKLLLDCEANGVADLRTRLSRYKLRAKVTIEDISGDYQVVAAYGADAPNLCGLDERLGATRAFDGGVLFVDPRRHGLGCRAILRRDTSLSLFTEAGFTPGTAADYDSHRLALGIPDGSRDMERERATLLESDFEALNGVDWDKGCYMGQELTARTKYRGLVKKRLMPVLVEGGLPPSGTAITAADKPVGTIRSGRGNRAMALLRLEALESGIPLHAGDAIVRPDRGI